MSHGSFADAFEDKELVGSCDIGSGLINYYHDDNSVISACNLYKSYFVGVECL